MTLKVVQDRNPKNDKSFLHCPVNTYANERKEISIQATCLRDWDFLLPLKRSFFTFKAAEIIRKK